MRYSGTVPTNYIPTRRDQVKRPDVITELKIENTIVRVLAYRKVTDSEFQHALQAWKRKRKIKTLPENKTITIESILGIF